MPRPLQTELFYCLSQLYGTGLHSSGPFGGCCLICLIGHLLEQRDGDAEAVTYPRNGEAFHIHKLGKFDNAVALLGGRHEVVATGQAGSGEFTGGDELEFLLGEVVVHASASEIVLDDVGDLVDAAVAVGKRAGGAKVDDAVGARGDGGLHNRSSGGDKAHTCDDDLLILWQVDCLFRGGGHEQRCHSQYCTWSIEVRMGSRGVQIESHLRNMTTWFPIVFVGGARGCGKTSLLTKVFPDYHYLDLENQATAAKARADPIGFLREHGSQLILDEVQNVPALFRALKVVADESEKPGQFIISGSVNYLRLNSVTESLAGRVGLVHLPPLSFREMGLPLDEFLLYPDEPNEANYITFDLQTFPSCEETKRYSWNTGLLGSDAADPAIFENFVVSETAKNLTNQGAESNLFLYRGVLVNEIEPSTMPRVDCVDAVNMVGDKLGVDASRRQVIYQGAEDFVLNEIRFIPVETYLSREDTRDS